MNFEEAHHFALGKLHSQLLDSFGSKREFTKTDSIRISELEKSIYLDQLSESELIPLLEEYLTYLKLHSAHERLVQLKLKEGMITRSQAQVELNSFDSVQVLWNIQNDLRESIKQLRRKDTTDYKYYAKIADLLLEHQEYESAIDCYNKCEMIEPKYHRARVQRVLAKYKMGRKSEACKEWITQGSESPSYFEKYCK
ncbi:MAG: hypothetical protein ABJF11_08160 [Reichenbachiella sp.]|uniref:hypothetical protein n=1 Tax=Reichenbachiella sp. TaxID=2184521 RepID=UPI003263B62A